MTELSDLRSFQMIEHTAEIRNDYAVGGRGPGRLSRYMRRGAFFDRWLNGIAAAVWDDAIAHAWQLNDPADTCFDGTESTDGCLVRADIDQALSENPYRRLTQRPA